MHDRANISAQFAVHLREAEAAARAIAQSVASIDDLVISTREAIVESRRLLTQADKLLSEEICADRRRALDQPASCPAFTPTASSAATRSPAE